MEKIIPIDVGILVKGEVKRNIAVICEATKVTYNILDYGGLIEHHLLLTIEGTDSSVSTCQSVLKNYIETLG